MLTEKKIADLHTAFDQMLGMEHVNWLARHTAPIDVDAPNQHASKRDFMI